MNIRRTSMTAPSKQTLERVVAVCWPHLTPTVAQQTASGTAVVCDTRSLARVLTQVVETSGPQTAMARYMAAALVNNRARIAPAPPG